MVIKMKMSDSPPENKLCELVIDDDIARINLNRSDVYNALNTELISELISLIKWTSDRSVYANSSLKDSELCWEEKQCVTQSCKLRSGAIPHGTTGSLVTHDREDREAQTHPPGPP